MFLLFAGDRYYATGGWHDFIGQYETLEKALEEVGQMRKDWAHIVYEGKVVWDSDEQ